MRHRFHALCPYFAMFPEDFAERWIMQLSRAGDTVLDPFCGRGTTPFQALLLGRRAIANDINPVAYCITYAKTNAPGIEVLERRLDELESAFEPLEWQEIAHAMSEFFHYAYAPTTLAQLLYLREKLDWRNASGDCMLAALSLWSLHGESQKSPFYFSNQMPRTISTKPQYSVQYWREKGLTAPQRNVFKILRNRIAFRYTSSPPADQAAIHLGDFRELPIHLASHAHCIRLVVTSPPYLDTTNFAEDQWLRLWFLGGPPEPTYHLISHDDRHRGPDTYWRLIADMWRVLGKVVSNDAHVVIRLGGKKLNTDRIVEGLAATSSFSGRTVSLIQVEVSEMGRRQTPSFRPGAPGGGREVDCCFRVS